MTPDQAREFVANNHRAVMITRRSAGGLQTSPVLVGIDSDGKVVISSRETAYKVRNLRRHSTATLCVFTDHFFGPWIQIDGTTEIVLLPQAMEGLIDYYRRISGDHPDWDDYRRAMVDQQRVLIRVAIDHVGPATPASAGRNGRPAASLLVDDAGVVGTAVGVHAADDHPGAVAGALGMLVPPFRSGTSPDKHAPAGRADTPLTGLGAQARIRSQEPIGSRARPRGPAGAGQQLPG